MTLEACHCPGSSAVDQGLAPYAVHGAPLPTCSICHKFTHYAARLTDTGGHVCRPCARRLLGDPDAT